MENLILLIMLTYETDSLLEPVTIVISKPLILSTLSKLTSGKIICSLIPNV